MPVTLAAWLSSPSDLLRVAGSAAIVFAVLVLLVRLAGLTSFSKMSSVDFAVTIAAGSVLGGAVLNPSPPLTSALLTLACLFLIQRVFAKLRRFDAFAAVAENKPLLLMDGATFREDAMRRAGVTHDDLRSKLREANVLSLDQVRAVVLEVTGDVSVLHGDPDGPPLDAALLKNVRGTDRDASG